MRPHRIALLALCLTTAAPAQQPRPMQAIPPLPALPALPVEGRVTHAGASIWFGSIGTGTPVILLHGGLSSSRAWGAQVAALVDAGYRVILIDSRGHGRSTLGHRPLGYERMAGDVIAVMDSLKLPRATIVGWSDGAIVGLVLAMRHAGRVDRLYAFGANMDQQGVRRDADQAPVLAEVGPRLAADYAALAPDPKGFAALHQAVQNMQKTQPRYRASQLASIRARAITIAAGAQDEFITDAHPRYLAAAIPGATLQIFAEAGHFAPWQQPEMFNRAVLAFLRGPASP